MKRTLFSAALFSALILGGVGFTSPAEAHVLMRDNGAAALLHIEPYDHPSANIPTTLVFSLSSDKNNVTLPDCNCIVTLQEGDKVVTRAALPVTIGGGNDGMLSLTFPKIDTYTLTLTGSSKSNRFTTFTLNYPIRVATAVPQSHTVRTVIIAGIVLLVLVAGTASLAYRSRKQSTFHKESK